MNLGVLEYSPLVGGELTSRVGRPLDPFLDSSRLTWFERWPV